MITTMVGGDGKKIGTVEPTKIKPDFDGLKDSLFEAGMDVGMTIAMMGDDNRLGFSVWEYCESTIEKLINVPPVAFGTWLSPEEEA